LLQNDIEDRQSLSWKQSEKGSIVQWKQVLAYKADAVDEELENRQIELSEICLLSNATTKDAAVNIPVKTMIRTYVAVCSKLRIDNYNLQTAQRLFFNEFNNFVNRGLLTYVVPNDKSVGPSTVSVSLDFLTNILDLLEVLICAKARNEKVAEELSDGAI
jgi:hypothetical protein